MWDVDSPLLTPKQRAALLGEFDDLSRENRRELRERVIGVLCDLSLLARIPSEERTKIFEKATKGELRPNPKAYSAVPEWSEFIEGTEWAKEFDLQDLPPEAQQVVIHGKLGMNPQPADLDQPEREELFRGMDRMGEEFLQLLATGLSFIFTGLLETGYQWEDLERLLAEAYQKTIEDSLSFPMLEPFTPLITTDVTANWDLAQDQSSLIEKLMNGEDPNPGDLIEHVQFQYNNSPNRLVALVDARRWYSGIFEEEMSLLDTLMILTYFQRATPSESGSMFSDHITRLADEIDGLDPDQLSSAIFEEHREVVGSNDPSEIVLDVLNLGYS